MTVGFRITVGGRWLARDYGNATERATLGQLEICAADCCLTLAEDRHAGAVRRFVNLSAYHLAFWLATNWWRLRWEPERAGMDWAMSHSTAAVGGGYIWPNITLVGDGEQITVQTRPTAGASWEPIRYLENWDVTIRPAEFETGIDAFVEEVLARLAACQVFETDLRALWRELRQERADPELSSRRKLEALAGYDPGEAPEAFIGTLRARAARDGRRAIDEIASGFGSDAASAADKIERALDDRGVRLRGDAFAKLAEVRRHWEGTGAPHHRAAEAAHHARELWNLDRSAPVADKALVEIAGASPRLLSEPADIPIPAARRGASEPDPWRALLRSRYRVGRRFELRRLMADVAELVVSDRLLPATMAKTSRQKFQRAFAQEFLCPVEALIESLGTGHPEDDEIEAAAAHFRVSPLLVRTGSSTTRSCRATISPSERHHRRETGPARAPSLLPRPRRSRSQHHAARSVPRRQDGPQRRVTHFLRNRMLPPIRRAAGTAALVQLPPFQRAPTSAANRSYSRIGRICSNSKLWANGRAAMKIRSISSCDSTSTTANTRR
jgi:hypothetical protein